LPAEALAEIDYWEVDPAWDGIVFRSAAQAVRPRGTRQRGLVTDRLPLASTAAGRPVSVRATFTNGDQGSQQMIAG
jgi:hypothetical protein